MNQLARILSALMVLTMMTILNGCGTGGSANDSDRTVFRYNQPNPVTSLDPAFARNLTNIWAVDHLYNGLLQFDEELNLQPAIASSWEILDDGLRYVFKLRDDVKFHDNECFIDGKGRKVVASDFVYSFNRIIDNKVNSPGSWIFKGKIRETDPFVALDDATLEVNLNRAFRPMLGIFAMQYCSVVPREAVERYGGDFRSNPVGTGAFEFKNWIENQALILTKNENYWEAGLPKVDAVRVNFMGDRNTGYLEFMNDNLDFISGLEASFADNLLTKDGELKQEVSEKIDFYKAPFLNMEYLGILMDFDSEENKDSPLRIKEVRQALNYAIDREKMLRTLRNNVGKVADAGFIPRGLPSYDPKAVQGYSYDPVKAAELLEKAGFPGGKGIPEIKLKTGNDYKDICTFVARQWEDVGIKVSIELMQSATLREMMRKGQASFFRASWIADYPDAENFLGVFYGKNEAPPNYTRFQNAEFDSLYEKALAENDDAKRYAIYQQMDRLLVEEAPVVFLFYDETARFSSKLVGGYTNNAINLLTVKHLSKE